VNVARQHDDIVDRIRRQALEQPIAAGDIAVPLVGIEGAIGAHELAHHHLLAEHAPARLAGLRRSELCDPTRSLMGFEQEAGAIASGESRLVTVGSASTAPTGTAPLAP